MVYHFVSRLAMSEGSSYSMPLQTLDIISLFIFNCYVYIYVASESTIYLPSDSLVEAMDCSSTLCRSCMCSLPLLLCFQFGVFLWNIGVLLSEDMRSHFALFSLQTPLFHLFFTLDVTGLLKGDFFNCQNRLMATEGASYQGWDNGTNQQTNGWVRSACESAQLINPLLTAMPLGCMNGGSDFSELPTRAALLSYMHRFSLVHSINSNCTLPMYQPWLWVPGMQALKGPSPFPVAPEDTRGEQCFEDESSRNGHIVRIAAIPLSGGGFLEEITPQYKGRFPVSSYQRVYEYPLLRESLTTTTPSMTWLRKGNRGRGPMNDREWWALHCSLYKAVGRYLFP